MPSSPRISPANVVVSTVGVVVALAIAIPVVIVLGGMELRQKWKGGWDKPRKG